MDDLSEINVKIRKYLKERSILFSIDEISSELGIDEKIVQKTLTRFRKEKRIKIQHLKGQPYEPADVLFLVLHLDDRSEDNKSRFFLDKSRYKIEILDKSWFYSQ